MPRIWVFSQTKDSAACTERSIRAFVCQMFMLVALFSPSNYMKYHFMVLRVVFMTTSLLKEFFLSPLGSRSWLFESSFGLLLGAAHLWSACMSEGFGILVFGITTSWPELETFLTSSEGVHMSFRVWSLGDGRVIASSSHVSEPLVCFQGGP